MEEIEMIIKRFLSVLVAVFLVSIIIEPLQWANAEENLSVEKSGFTWIEKTGTDYGFIDMEKRSNPDGKKHYITIL